MYTSLDLSGISWEFIRQCPCIYCLRLGNENGSGSRCTRHQVAVHPSVITIKQSASLGVSLMGKKKKNYLIRFLMKPNTNRWLNQNQNQTSDWLKNMQTNYRASLGAPSTIILLSNVFQKCISIFFFFFFFNNFLILIFFFKRMDYKNLVFIYFYYFQYDFYFFLFLNLIIRVRKYFRLNTISKEIFKYSFKLFCNNKNTIKIQIYFVITYYDGK